MPPALARATLSQTTLREYGGTEETVRINSAAELLTGTDRSGLAAWLDPTGNLRVPLRLRAALANAPYPITALIHGFSAHSLLYGWFLRVLLSGLLPCDSVICTSRAARAALRRIFEHVAEGFNRQLGTKLAYEGRTDLIPLCVDFEDYQPGDRAKARRKLGIPQNAFVMLFVGRLSLVDKADLFPLLRVLAQLVREFPERGLLLVAAGTERGPYARALRQSAQALGIAGNLKVLLGITDPDKRSLFSAADVFVSPADSISEAFGLTPVEAMACGVPQVVADWDGYRDTVVHGETGFLVPTCWAPCTDDLTDTGPLFGWHFDHFAVAQSVCVDPAALARYLRCLVQSDDLRRRMGERSRARARAHFAGEVIARRYAELWVELSAIARRLDGIPRPCAFDRPAYWKCFEHYASAWVGDATLLRLTELGIRRLSSGDSLLPPHPDYVNLPILSEELLRGLLARLSYRAPGGAGGPGNGEAVSMHELVAGSSSHGSVSRVVRHVMWLMKHGFIEIVPENGGASRGAGV